MKITNPIKLEKIERIKKILKRKKLDWHFNFNRARRAELDNLEYMEEYHDDVAQEIDIIIKALKEYLERLENPKKKN